MKTEEVYCYLPKRLPKYKFQRKRRDLLQEIYIFEHSKKKKTTKKFNLINIEQLFNILLYSSYRSLFYWRRLKILTTFKKSKSGLYLGRYQII